MKRSGADGAGTLGIRAARNDLLFARSVIPLIGTEKGARDMVNANEQAVVDKYVAAGWTVLRRGEPDFIFFKTDERGDIVDDLAVEVKSATDVLSYSQKVYRKFLERHGVPYKVEVVMNDHPTTQQR